jgi:hypothetical protein
MRNLGVWGAVSRPDISWSGGVTAAACNRLKPWAINMATSSRNERAHVANSGLIMVSGMGMVVKPGAFGALLRCFGARRPSPSLNCGLPWLLCRFMPPTKPRGSNDHRLTRRPTRQLCESYCRLSEATKAWVDDARQTGELCLFVGLLPMMEREYNDAVDPRDNLCAGRPGPAGFFHFSG